VAPLLGYTPKQALTIQAATGTAEEGGVGDAAQALLEISSAQAQGALGSTQSQAQNEYGVIQTLSYPSFLKVFINGAQTVVDSGDSSVWATKTQETPTLVHQVIGNGADIPSDEVIPNDTTLNGYPLGGTNGLLNALGLTQSSGTQTNAEGLRTYVNFTAGDHGSSLDPSASLDATTEMQTQIITFLLSQGTNIFVTDASVVE
jgi:hypothetical protein